MSFYGYGNPAAPGIGFSGQPQNYSQGSSALPYPDAGGAGFPCPPAASSSFCNPPQSQLPYSLYPIDTSTFNPQPSATFSSGPYPPQGAYPPQSSTYPLQSSPYPQQSSPYPPQGASYPLQSSSYPPQSSPYPPQSSSPYPPQSSTFAPYPPQSSASAPYPPQSSASAPYAPQSSASAPYPSQSSSYPYNQAPLGSSSHTSNPSHQNRLNEAPYPPQSSSPYSVLPSCPGAPQNPSPNPGYPSTYGAPSGGVCAGGYPAGDMWPYQERATVVAAAPFDATGDAGVLQKAMKGFGTDEQAIIRLLTRRTSAQRLQILQRFQQAYGKDLKKAISGETSGRFCEVLLALLTPLPTYLANQINKAISGLGTTEKALQQILCGADNNLIREIKVAYQQTYRKPLETDLRGDTSGYFRRTLVALAAGCRDETGNDFSVAPQLARSLLNAGVRKMGTDEIEFIRVLSSYSFPVLRRVFREYEKISGGKTFESAIRSELSGDLRDSLLALHDVITNRAAFFARVLQEALKGFGTDDDTLVRTLVWRSEIDLANVRDEFVRRYKRRLEDAVASDTSGDYKKILLALISG